MTREEAAGWLRREVVPAAGIAAGLGCLVMVTEARHQARWHPNGIGRSRCEAGHCVSRGSARARWRARARRMSPHPIGPVPGIRRSARLGA